MDRVDQEPVRNFPVANRPAGDYLCLAWALNPLAETDMAPPIDEICDNVGSRYALSGLA
jgi:hypothetical protein